MISVHGLSTEKRVTKRVAEVVVEPVGLIVFQIRTLITLISRNMDGFSITGINAWHNAQKAAHPSGNAIIFN